MIGVGELWLSCLFLFAPQVIKDIPAATIDKFFMELQYSAASKIQAAWLGSRTRSKLAQSKPRRLQHKAAITIQRQVTFYF